MSLLTSRTVEVTTAQAAQRVCAVDSFYLLYPVTWTLDETFETLDRELTGTLLERV